MTDSAVSVFIDTNCFIQLRDLKDLPWQDMFPGSPSIEIVITPIIVDELDRMKNDGRERLRTRSRAALKLIELASDAPDMRLLLRDAPVLLTMRVVGGIQFDWAAYPQLDHSSNDDRLVASALAFPAAGQAALVSYDTGPLIRARAHNLKAKKPSADWELPDENTEINRENAKLRRENEDLRAQRPSIDLSFKNGRHENGTLRLRAPLLPPLNADLVAELAREMVSKNPPHGLGAADNTASFMSARRGYSSYTIDKYETDYDAFVAGAQPWFAQLHECIRATRRNPRIEIEAANRSAVTAHNFLLSYRGPGDAILITSEMTASGYGAMVRTPTAPKKPKTGDQEEMDRIRTMVNVGGANDPRDPTSFYWQDRPSPDDPYASLLCHEFRARESYEGCFWLYLHETLPYAGTIVISASATNLSAPVNLEAQLNVFEESASWTDADVLAELDDWIADRIRAAHNV